MKKTRAPRPVWNTTIYNDADLPARCDIATAAAYLRVSRNWISQRLHDGTLPGIRVGNGWRIRKEDLIGFTGQQEEGAR